MGKGWREGRRGRHPLTRTFTHRSRIDSKKKYSNKSKNKGGGVILPVMPERRGNSLKRFW
jgi:hypothetical protein